MRERKRVTQSERAKESNGQGKMERVTDKQSERQ